MSHFPATRLLRIDSGTQARRWLARLCQEGVAQVVVPESLAEEVVQVWKDAGGDPGWVLTWDEVLKARGGFAPLAVSTAIVLPGVSGGEVDRAWSWKEGWRELISWVVAFPGTRVHGRYLEDVASHRPPVVLEAEER